MRQGEVYLLRQKRTVAQRFRGEPVREQQVLIISSTAFNGRRDAPVVWGIPGDEDGHEPRVLTSIDRRHVAIQVGAVDGRELDRVLRYLHWGFVGDGPFIDPVDGLLDTVAAAPGAASDLSQGEVVVDEEGIMMVVASGRGFNATAGGDALWGILVELSGMVHPHIVMTRTRDEVRRTGMEISTDGVRRNVGTILRMILGVEP
jgi:hypothetical protein